MISKHNQEMEAFFTPQEGAKQTILAVISLHYLSPASK
jgi:hypothetical protein